MRSLIAETYTKSLSNSTVTAKSSGTSVGWNDPQERQYFYETLGLLRSNNIAHYAKSQPEQLTPERILKNDYIIFMNQRVVDEAAQLLPNLPTKYEVWEITDIGEGTRIDRTKKQEYLQAIYDEITSRVDTLLAQNQKSP